MPYMSVAVAKKTLTRGVSRGGAVSDNAGHRGGLGHVISVPYWKQNATPAVGPSRRRGAVRFLRCFGVARRSSANKRAARKRRKSDAVPRHRLIYRTEEWSRESLLKMVGVDPHNLTTQMKYHF